MTGDLFRYPTKGEWILGVLESIGGVASTREISNVTSIDFRTTSRVMELLADQGYVSKVSGPVTRPGRRGRFSPKWKLARK